MAFGDGVMGMQAFRMDDPYGEPARLWITLQGAVQPAHRVLAEHQVLPVGEGEGLLVGAFHRSLHRGAEGAFAEIRQLFQGSPMQSSARPMRRCAPLRWLCGVATMPALLPSQASTLA